MTGVGKCRRKKSPGKIRILGPSGFWNAGYGVPHCILERKTLFILMQLKMSITAKDISFSLKTEYLN
jgi:hypothetical protein